MEKYRQFGLVNTRAMFEKAYREGYAVPAFNFVSLEQLLAIMEAARATETPLIVQCSANVRKHLGAIMVQRLVQAAVETLRAEGSRIPVALHLDHGMTFEECASCVDSGFSSVMIDGSALPYEQNVAVSRRVVEYAHAHDVTVEGELGVLAGVEEEGHASAGASRYTDPDQAADFVRQTGVDSLAISIGTSHGVVKVRPRPNGSLPELRFDILQAVAERLPGFPLVLHGASNILPEHVRTINEHGGKLTEARGIPEDQVRAAAALAVCKVNTASDGWIAFTATARRVLAEQPDLIDPRAFLKPAIGAMRRVYEHKVRAVFGSAGKGADA